MMSDNLTQFLIQWGITAISLGVASLVFRGIRFSGPAALLVSALLLGFANALIRPVLLILTFPLTLLTLGLFILVINALMLQLVSLIVRGFSLSGFWTAFFASLFISVLSLSLDTLVPNADVTIYRLPTTGNTISM